MDLSPFKLDIDELIEEFVQVLKLFSFSFVRRIFVSSSSSFSFLSGCVIPYGVLY